MSLFTTNIFRGLGRVALLVLVVSSATYVHAQESADKILVIVGKNRIILQSELETELMQARQMNPALGDSEKCLILQQMITRKMLVEQAERDSVMVSDDDVEGTLDNRVRYFMQMYGSKEKLEQLSGKSIYQMKEENRETVKEQMIAEKMQNQVLENSKITPAEVEAFFKKIPVDSLPFFPASVELGQIVIDPPISNEMLDFAHKRLEEVRDKIVKEGASFELMVGAYSDDPGSRDNGGRYDGITRNGPWAPEFIAATFKLQNGEISPIFKTKFGYHIIQMINRKGDEADVRHILKKPSLTSADYQKSLNTLDSIRNLLVSGKMTFQEAVGKFSTDEAAKRTGGMLAEPTTGNTNLDVTKLDAGMLLIIDSLKPGEFSPAHIFMTDQREKSCRIVFMRSRTAPHKANTVEDYSRIQEVALAQKKQQKMLTWVKNKLPSFYLKIAPEYRECSSLKAWRTNNESTK